MRAFLGVSRFVIGIFAMKTGKQLAVGIGPPIETTVPSYAVPCDGHFGE